MTDPTQQPVAISTEQVLAALAASLLPLAGPYGIAASAVVPALEQLIASFRNQPADKNYTVDELAAIVSGGSAHLAQLTAHVNALPGGQP